MFGDDRHRFTLVLCCAALVLVPALASGQIFYVPTETPEQGKAFSEFNHRLAGVFLLGIGAMAAASHLPKLRFIAKIWPFLFILPGLYLAAMSDPEVWPMGHQSWLEAFRVNPEGRQHKIFALLLLALGTLELVRAAGKLGRGLATWGFPALAAFGATLLFFHPHTIDAVAPVSAQATESKSAEPAGQASTGHDMASHAGHGAAAQAAPDQAAKEASPAAAEHQGHVMTETMLKVEKQHFWFSLVGFGIALFKFLQDGKYWRRPFVPFLWPSFMSILGVLLIVYAE